MTNLTDTNMDEPGTAIPLGIDDGFAATKVALPDGRLVTIASRGRIGKAAVSQIAGISRNGAVAEYLTEETIYSVGEVDGMSTRFDGYASSGLNRAIVQHALQAAGFAGRSIHAVSGLPMSAFYLPDGSKRTAAIEAKRASLLRAVSCIDGGRPAEIAFHAVIPEALAAWYDYVIDDTSGEPRLDKERASRPVAVIDIGGRTTDYAVIDRQTLQHAASGSVSRGLLDIKAALAGAIQQRFDLEHVDERQVDGALRSGQARLFGQDHDFCREVAAAKGMLLEALLDETRGKLGRGAGVDAVHFVGGGAVVLAEDVQTWFPHGSIAAHPVFANARGMLKFLRYVCEDGP